MPHQSRISKQMKFPLAKPFFDDDDLEQIRRTLESGWVAGLGPMNVEFAKIFADFVSASYAVPVSNCTVALHLALLVSNVGKRDEVIVADYTYPATAHAICYCKATPIFADIKPDSYNIDPEQIRGLITKKTKAILPVHTFGQTAELAPIMEIAQEKDLIVVEDAACAAGAEYNGKKVGSFGNLACFSFHARKSITSGEGGIVVTNNEEKADQIRKMSCFGLEYRTPASPTSRDLFIPQFSQLGFNYKLSDISATLLISQMRKLERLIDHRRALARVYDRLLRESGDLTPPIVGSKVKHVYQSYVALAQSRKQRNGLILGLRKQGIEANIGTYACHLEPVYSSAQKCPVSSDIFNRAIALPIYYSLREEDVLEICETIHRTLTSLD